MNLNRGFETQLNDLILSIRKTVRASSQIERFSNAAQHIKDFVSVYQPRGRGLAMFFDTTDGFFWHKDFDLPFQNDARWDRELLTQPLANAMDQFERYGVVLVDRAKLRLFTVFLNDIEESGEMDFGPGRTRHIKTSGTENAGSSSHIQRKADEQVHANLRSAVTAIDSFVRTKQAGRLILAGTPEVTAELRSLFPKRLSLRVIGSVELATSATQQEVLAATQPIADKYERAGEIQTVNEVLTAAAKSERAVIGLGRTLKALNSNRVWQFIYSEGCSSPGFECSKCSALFSIEKKECAYCGGAVYRIGNIVERAVEHAFRNGARIEVVTGEAAASLDSAGGIAAFLKTRTASMRA